MNMGQDRQMQMIGGNGGNQFRQYAGHNARNPAGYNDVIRNQIRNGNLVAAHTEGNVAGQNGNQIRCYNCRGVGPYARNCTVRPMRRDVAYLQTQLLIAQKKEAGIQLQAEEYDLMAAAADLDEIEEVNYTELLKLIPESHQVPQNNNDVISEDTSVEQGGEPVEQHPANFEETRALYESLYQNLAIEVEKVNSVNRKLKETNANLTTELARFKNQERLKSDFKTCEDKLLDKHIQLEKKINELNNIVIKTGQLIQTIHMLSPKPDSFYHTEQKMALGYQNPFYLKQAQKKKQSLYDGKVLHEKHDPPVVHDSEETLQLAQESRDKMKQMNKEIKPANYTKINHLSGDFLDDTTPSVARKFLNEVKSTIVTLQRVVKQRMTIETHNWPSSAHQELHKIVRDEIFSIVNQVDARLQNFEIQFLKEAANFVGDFKSLANEADASLAKHKALELEIERLLKAVVSQDIMIIVQNESVVDTSDLQTELELGETNALSKPVTSNSVSTPQEPKGVNNDKVIAPRMFRINPSKTSREEKHVPNTLSASNRTKPITVSQPPVISYSDLFMVCRFGLFQAYDRKSKAFINFVWKFMGTVRFGNDHVASILGFGDLQWGNILITRVYFVEGLGHNLFSIGQFCDSDLEVTFRRNTCFVRNLEGVDLLKGDRSTNLMKSSFKMSMMGELTFFLGLQVNQSPCGIFVNQSKYVLEILNKYGMESCDPVGTPMEIKDTLDLDQNGTSIDATKYRSMIGALMYLTSSRPDIVHATCLCARYQAKPTEKHLKEVKRIFRYLLGTINTGLWYTKDFGFELTGFSDADYAGCKDTFKSTSGGA
nr:uncharacterized mitochondrial protein AtMg00810-like [Tanacetum cinerariifolium]